MWVQFPEIKVFEKKYLSIGESDALEILNDYQKGESLRKYRKIYNFDALKWVASCRWFFKGDIFTVPFANLAE